MRMRPRSDVDRECGSRARYVVWEGWSDEKISQVRRGLDSIAGWVSVKGQLSIIVGTGAVVSMSMLLCSRDVRVGCCADDAAYWESTAANSGSTSCSSRQSFVEMRTRARAGRGGGRGSRRVFRPMF